ncbi:MAG TPA: sterol desaturase family protein [Accumulibacter sp.]|uniref:sterol desaturase family protein n=1 Tax=Accumulibacter sp. TaxID=2053492 RepID=UPI002CC51355|nr:sterol desaturase family protein [Accumulibacter sp.]HNK04336.1 sterol desaturase family protein [Accumulibacter sp.]
MDWGSIDAMRASLTGGAFDWRVWLLPLALPVILFLVLLEWWHFRRKDIYDWRDTLASLPLGAGYALSEAVLLSLFMNEVFLFVYAHRLTTISMSLWSFLLLYLIVDLCFYAFHRAAHRIRFLWCIHAVHHSSEHYNFSVAFRQSPLYAFAGSYFFFLPPIWLGFEVEWVLCALSINLLYQLTQHTQWIGHLPPWIDWWLMTPQHHKIHHASNPRYIDRNYAGTFVVWDRLFGTFIAEAPEDPPRFGLVKPLRSFNPLTLMLHEWGALAANVARPGPWWQRLRHLWSPPEWERATSATDASTRLHNQANGEKLA